ncbi:MAG TPA: hypothetical protein VM512_06375 [Burkholderiaceae bacterium]|jgi:hypothetical protein|nr:hypothetical protein [Burkholderiaceae bacterium]
MNLYDGYLAGSMPAPAWNRAGFPQSVQACSLLDLSDIFMGIRGLTSGFSPGARRSIPASLPCCRSKNAPF